MASSNQSSPPPSSKKEKKCRKASQFYQNRFPDIPPMSSSELLQRNLDENLIIVDVRTKPERQVSMIIGAISLETFERDVVDTLPTSGDQLPTIVTYCTIGYRSGMEARRLRQKYHLEGRIYSLDGIVAYTHARAALENEENSNSNGELAAKRRLIRTADAPNTQQPAMEETNQVHTFGAVWNLAQDGYVTRHFSIFVLLGRTAQVGGTTVLRSFQSLAFACASCCGREKLH
jgi:rhodanese-related sulfurtransferase